MTTQSDRVLFGYVGLVSVAGGAALGVMLAFGGHTFPVHAAYFWILVAGVLVGELRPVRILARATLEESPSTAFMFALLLGAGPPAAASALALASILSDAVNKKDWYKATFNVGQYVLACGAAGVVIRLLSGSWILVRHGRLRSGDIPPLLLGMLAYFLVNNLLIGLVMAFAQRQPILRRLRQEIALQAATDGVLLGLAPVVLVVAEGSIALIPFLLVPIGAVYISTYVSLSKQHQALHDSLTGLPNRMLFLERVQEAVALKSSGASLAVMILDLDGFKDVNDTLGHNIGDLLLQQVGLRLAGIVDAGDLVARLGGDEFAVMASEATSSVAARTGQRLVAALADPFVVGDLRLHVDASVGISVYPDDAEDADTLLQRADVAMYVAKDEGTRVELYSTDRDVHSRRRLALLGELRGAIADGQLTLHYQPAVDLATGRIVGVEALVRWMHPTLGNLPPIEFVPLAERSGLIGPLTHHVLEAAIDQNAAWQAEGIKLRTAVNLSVRNLADLELPLLVAKLLDRAGISADCLDLEITESTIMADPVRAMTVLKPLSEMGIRLAIDDFGTGYSSLAYLRQLPLSILKIDKSFVGQMADNDNDAIIVRSTVELAHNLGLEVIAEGVETEVAAKMLLEFGCGVAQGYFFARPQPVAEVTGLLRSMAELPVHEAQAL